MAAIPQKKRPLQAMFTEVPPSYDRLNRILTLGADENWRKIAVDHCLKNDPGQVLDLCCGTGDLTLRLRRKAKSGVVIRGLDFSSTMLEVARKKADKKGINDVEFIAGDAANMPFEDETFDSIGISFGFRNLTFENPDRDIFLKEILRVLKPGGQLVIVETSQPSNKLWRMLYHLYMRTITAPLGGLLSGNPKAYRYLSFSARNFYSPAGLRSLLLSAGFSSVESKPLLGGISAVTTVVK